MDPRTKDEPPLDDMSDGELEFEDEFLTDDESLEDELLDELDL